VRCCDYCQKQCDVPMPYCACALKRLHYVTLALPRLPPHVVVMAPLQWPSPLVDAHSGHGNMLTGVHNTLLYCHCHTLLYMTARMSLQPCSALVHCNG
jgi:hypothetical protein